VKCFEITNCSEQTRKNCIVWTSFQTSPEELDNIKCWVIKGVYHEENKAQLIKCRKCNYYMMMNRETGILSDIRSDIATITCDGVINNDRTRALEKVWSTLKQNKKFKIILDFSSVNNIYSCGLGLLVKMHKEAQNENGHLIVTGVQGYVLTIFTSTKLSRLLHMAADRPAAIDFFDLQKKKIEEALEAERELAEKESAEKIKAAKALKATQRVVSCWEYWENHNPKNATKCDQCFRKNSPKKENCWVVEGVIEGVSFQYVNEECEGCKYYQIYGPTSD
jgi:anti-anti-sigma factor